jgi:hypothetical protein
VRIDGHRVHCQSEGNILDAGTFVRVISARANRVVVRRVDPDSPEMRPNADDEAGRAADEPLDFDLS